ncbi:MAG: SGNH/GDSL hydrolase family protein [Methylophilaceae bacterium]
MASYVIFNHGKNYYHSLNALRLDPLELHKVDITNPPENLALVFYGDSRAQQWPEPDWLKGRTLNIGIGGQTTEQILARFDHHLSPLSPKVVVVQAGMNDIKTIPLFPNQEAEIIARCKENLKKIVEQSQQQGIHVFITTIFPTGKLPLVRRPFWSDRVNFAMGDINQYIHSFASDSVTVIESKDVLAGKNGLIKPAFSYDFLHLTTAGYDKLNDSLRDTVESTLLKSSGRP